MRNMALDDNDIRLIREVLREEMEPIREQTQKFQITLFGPEGSNGLYSKMAEQEKATESLRASTAKLGERFYAFRKLVYTVGGAIGTATTTLITTYFKQH